MGRKKIGVGLSVVGLAMFLASLALPDSWLRAGSWGKSQALAYQKASAELHRLSLTADSNREAMNDLRESRLVFAELEGEREAAAQTGGARRFAMRWGGLALALGGAFWSRRQKA